MERDKKSLIQILTSLRWPIYILSALIFIGLVTGLVVREVRVSRGEASIRAIEEIETKYQEWQETGEENNIPPEITTEALGITAQYPRQYGSLRAYQLLSRIAWEEEDYQKVLEYSLDLVDRFASSHSAPASLYTAAAAYEEQDDPAQAQMLYQQLVNTYPDSFEVPQALFSIGRIQEEAALYEEAAETYTKLFDEFSSLDWGKFAKNRIIYLQTAGHLIGDE